MRGYLTFFVIAVMSLGLAFLLVTRSRSPHDAPAEILPPPVASADAGADAAAAAPDAGIAAKDASAPDAAPAPKPALRPLRVVSLGWELVAAGAAIATPDAGAAPAFELAPETSLEAVEARLARGGADPTGADVAIVPLPSFIVSYDRLRALDPRAFMVVGFSRGREEVHAAPGALLKAPPATDEVKLVALGPAMTDPGARAMGSDAATALGLFALDTLGVAPARVRFIMPGSADAKTPAYAAVVRGAADDRKLVFSTADASRFVPIVAVAPKSLVDSDEGRLRELARTWFEGLDRAGKDASGVARRLANKDGLPLAAGVGGAPEAIALLERLGQIEPAKLSEQQLWIGPSARPSASLSKLTQHTWQLLRGGGLTASAAPEGLPIDPRVVVAIAPAPPKVETPAADADAGATFAPAPAKATAILAYRADSSADVDSVAAEIGYLANVFERAAFRVSAKGGDKAAKAIAAAARDKEGVSAARLSTTATEPAGAFASVDILVLP